MTPCIPGHVWRMPWLLHYLIIILPLSMSMVSVVDSGRKLPPIYWNSSSALFRRNDSSINIQVNDNVDVMCPDYNNSQVPKSNWEYYIIYLVSKREYDHCEIFDPRSSDVTKIINCSSPETSDKKFTLLILTFQPVPSMPDFKLGQKYYLISTSTGSESGINNQVNGSCRTHNMRLILDLTDKPVTASPSPHTPSTIPSSQATPQPTPSPTHRPPSTTTTTTTTTTTQKPTTTTKKPTSKFPDGTPHDPNIVIEAPGGETNSGIITAGEETLRSSVTLTCVLSLVTFLLLVR